MKQLKLVMLAFCCMCLVSAAITTHASKAQQADKERLANVKRHFSSIQNSPSALYAFFHAMPKGGELHYHLAGGAYGETMLKLAGTRKDYCINLTNNSVYKKKQGKRCEFSASKLESNPQLYDSLLNAWSMRAFIASNGYSGHDHFFSTFEKFILIISDFRSQLLAEVMQRAANQHEQYMEIMDMPDDGRSMQFTPQHFALKDMANIRNTLLQNKAFQKNIEATVEVAKSSLVNSRNILNCNVQPRLRVSNLVIKIQAYVLREQPINNIFVQALNAFEAASRSDAIIAVNLVQSEGGIISLRDYRKQMRVFEFMHQHYPNVHITLHAGELTNNLVMPDDLRFHIQDAIDIGKAQRIGHGVDIAWENNSKSILESMKKRNIAVEINLVSNQKILGVSGAQHPLNYYLKHGVAVTLSSDDEGVLRTDLTAQFVEAAYQHRLDYETLRRINHNTLTYSFLPGKSLWSTTAKNSPVAACIDLMSPSCLDYVNHSKKAAQQRALELTLRRFEEGF